MRTFLSFLLGSILTTTLILLILKIIPLTEFFIFMFGMGSGILLFVIIIAILWHKN